MRKMKKVMAAMLAATMTMSMGMTALAVESESKPTDMSTVTITKNYNVDGATGITSPAETFAFTIERTSVTDAASGVTDQNMPLPTIGNVSYAKGEAGSNTKSKTITVTMPTYTSVGIYTYTIKETAGTTAGVTYYGNDIRLVVTVIQDGDNKVRVAAVHTEGEGQAKANGFPNVYSAGSLEVKKVVTGNMGDRTKPFTVTVAFTAPQGKTVNEAISYTDDGEDKTIETSAWENGAATAVITLKHDETVTFTNIPYDVTYTVVESDYSRDGYAAAGYDFSDNNKKIDSASDSVVITNNKGVTVDTGINLDNAPYILLLVIAALGMFGFVSKKRSSEF